MNPDPDPDLTIVLLGKAGVGKSASGNTILGRTAFESELSFEPVTKQICEKRGNVFGKLISVVDTPGILDYKDTEEKIKTFCQDLLQSSRCCLFLVVLRVGRFTREDQKAVRGAMRVLGPQGMKNSYLLFTGGDALKSMSLDAFLHKYKNKGEKQDENLGDDYKVKKVTLPNVVCMFAGAYHLFNNEMDDEEQVRELLLKSGHLRTQKHPDSPADVSRDRRIVLLGLPGAGKSSSGNTILGSKKFRPGCDFHSVTPETVSESATVEGRRVTVVDTPGFTDEVLTPEQLFKEIMKSIVEASPGPHAFVVVVRIGRITERDIKLFELLPKLFDSDVCDAHQYSMVLFTHGDELEGRSIDDLIQSNRHVSALVSMCGGRYCVFDNKAKRNREQVRHFLDKIDEMVTANVGQHFTSDLFRMADTFIKEERSRSADDSRDRRIVLLGLPGAGKSSSGNTILGSKKFRPGCDFHSVTPETVSESATVEGRRVTVMDTPGFTDEVLTPEQLFKEIMKSIVEASPGPHAFVVVVRIGRITERDIKLFELLPKLFDSDVCDAHQYSMVLLTHGDELEGRSIDDLIKSNRHVSALVSMCGGRYCVLNNKAKRSREQVRHFLDKIDEMVTANVGQHFTSELFRMAETLIKEERNRSGETTGASAKFSCIVA
ncbi:GTPase IMAP family member 8-like isoform X2 [Sparus aurata]|uniref:GTPase IMAP family member 8-like n=1 Tax=Sparus aurata TaxID=8175 RepID=A0A671TQH0_SPAAU|nr:GTPase IMAP family member 8-like isoform X2 [Sparus aurata]